jgi:hypothetical protein
MGRQIRGHIKPNTLERSKLSHVEMPSIDKTTWTKIEYKDEVKHHLIERNVEQFSHAVATLFGYTDLGKELGDSDIAEDILDGTLEHECMNV